MIISCVHAGHFGAGCEKGTITQGRRKQSPDGQAQLDIGDKVVNSIYVMGMVEELENSGLGVKEEEGWCGALLYADDIVLLAESPDELQRMLDTVGEYAEE